MDQVAELLSLIKKDNDIDNPKIAYIEYTAQSAVVRIGLDDPIQRHSKRIYDYIRNSGECGDGGDGISNFVAGLDAALNEFEINGNPGAVQKIISINNCQNSHFDDDNGGIVYDDEPICNRIHSQMIDAEIEGIVINMAMNNGANYLSCLVDDDLSRICAGNAITEREYRRVYNQCVPEICTGNGHEHTPNPAQVATLEPTKEGFKYPTRPPSTSEAPTASPTEATMWPTPSPLIHSWPSSKPETSTIYTTESNVTPEPTPNPTMFPTESPSGSPTSDPTNFPTENPISAPSLSPTLYPTPEPTMRPTNISKSTLMPSTSTTMEVFVTTNLCPVCLSDIDDSAETYSDDEHSYFALPLPPKDIVFTAHSVGLNKRHSLPLNVMYTNKDYEDGQVEDDGEHHSNIKYFMVLFIVSVNIIVCLWFVLKAEKREVIMGYFAGHKVHTKILSEAQIEESDDEEDEYQTSTDVDEIYTEDEEY